MRPSLLIRLSFVSIAALASMSASALDYREGEYIEGYFKPVDGDNLKYGNLNIRIWGIDAPDRQRDKPMSHFYKASKAQLGYYAQVPVRCVFTGKKSFNRPVARCFQIASRNDLAALMTGSGYAVEWRSFSKGTYSDFENYARLNRLGLWSQMSVSWR